MIPFVCTMGECGMLMQRVIPYKLQLLPKLYRTCYLSQKQLPYPPYLFFFRIIILPLQEASLFLSRGNKGCEKKIKNQEVYVVSHIICKTTAADSFETEAAEIITLSPPPQKKSGKNTWLGKWRE